MYTVTHETHFDSYDESRFRNEFKCDTRIKKTANGDTYHLVTHHSNSVKSGYAKQGQYVTKDMYMDIAMQELESIGKDKKLPRDIVNYIASFISYPSIAEVNKINTELYLRTYISNSIYKSAIFNESKQLVCIAPAKPMNSDIFCDEFQGDVKYNIDEIYDTEKIYKDFDFHPILKGGIKINAFYDNGKWYLSTVHAIHAIDECDLNMYKKNKDIATFIGCSRELNVDWEHDFEKDLCYSFVCQTNGDPYENLPTIIITGIYKIDNTKNIISSLSLSNFERTTMYQEGRYKPNPFIYIQTQSMGVNFNILKLIVSEWAPGKHLPSEVWENDMNEGRFLQHHAGEKGIIIVHKKTGIHTEVLNRNYLHYVIPDKLNRDTQ